MSPDSGTSICHKHRRKKEKRKIERKEGRKEKKKYALIVLRVMGQKIKI